MKRHKLSISILDGDGDAYGFLDISKDRQVEIKEVEEPVKRITISRVERGEFKPDPTKKDLMDAEIFGLQRCEYGHGHSYEPAVELEF